MLIKLFFTLSIINIMSGMTEIDDFHTSITAFEKIFQTESYLLENLENYIVKSELRVKDLKSELSKLQNNNKSLIQNTMHDAFYKFVETSHLIQKKKAVEKLLYDSIGTKIIKNITNYRLNSSYPTDTDLVGVSLGIYRLQYIYNMSATSIANGQLLNKNYNRTLSASDCYHIGYNLYYQGNYKYAAVWFKEALDRFPNETSTFKAPIRKVSILDFLSFATFTSAEGNLNQLKQAIEYVKSAIELEPNNEYLLGNLKKFQSQFEYISNIQQNTTIVSPNNENQYDVERKLLPRVCRGEVTKTPLELRKLHCKYEKDNHPFLKLAPIKLEIANFEPYIVIFHDVLDDNEIKTIQKLSLKILVRAGVWNEKKGIGEPSNVRTSKFAWLNNDAHILMHTINQRLSDMTGLSMETSEPLQVMNYGIGGHYDIHSDSFTEPDGNNIKPYGNHHFGNRIATVLFYMSNVEQGGGTAYPWVKTLVLPKKGAAAFWMNGFLSGDSNLRSRHSGCPVIVGSKWVANKWIRYRGQTFLKKCKLHDDKVDFDYTSLMDRIERNIPINV